MHTTPEKTVHFKMDEQLLRQLKEFSTAEGRPLAERARYLTEVALLILRRQPRFPFPRESSDPPRMNPKGEVKFEISQEDFDLLFDKAHRLGLHVTAMVRTSIRMVLFEKQQCAPGARMIDKEELASLILEHSMPSYVN